MYINKCELVHIYSLLHIYQQMELLMYINIRTCCGADGGERADCAARADGGRDGGRLERRDGGQLERRDGGRRRAPTGSGGRDGGLDGGRYGGRYGGRDGGRDGGLRRATAGSGGRRRAPAV
jgi:hypothetical protein